MEVCFDVVVDYCGYVVLVCYGYCVDWYVDVGEVVGCGWFVVFVVWCGGFWYLVLVFYL